MPSTSARFAAFTLIAAMLATSAACNEPANEARTSSQPAPSGTGANGISKCGDDTSEIATIDPAVKAELERLAPAIAAELRANLGRIPDEKKIVISEDIIGVKGSCDPHNLSGPIGLGLHHIPSATVFGIDQSGDVVGVSVRGKPVSRNETGYEGIAILDEVVSDREVMDRIVEFLAE